MRGLSVELYIESKFLLIFFDETTKILSVTEKKKLTQHDKKCSSFDLSQFLEKNCFFFVVVF